MTTLSIEHRDQKSEHFIYVPKDFDPDDFPGPIKKYPDAARWFLNCIHFRRVTRHFGHDEYINLHSGLLSLVMGKNDLVRPVREALVANGLVESDNTWSLGKKSLGYRLGPKLKGCRWQRYYSTNKRFIKRLVAFKDYVTTAKNLTTPAHQHLRHWVNKVRLHPDHRVVFDSLEDEQRHLAQLQAEKIEQGCVNVSVCEYGRFHSNFSCLARVLRPYLTIDGEPLQEVDLVNSQPFFLSTILLELALSKNSKNVNSLSDLVFDCMHLMSLRRKEEEREGEEELYVPPFSESQKNPEEEGRRGEEEEEEEEELYVPPFRKEETTSVLDLIPTDLRLFVERSINGGFYESFLERGQSGLDRDELKEKVFRVLYGNRHLQANDHLGPKFKAMYPTAFDMLDKLKKEMGYEWVGRELQRRESDTVINGLVEELRTSHKHIPILTVHDSVLTTAKYMPTVKAILREHLSKNYFQPKLKDKPSKLATSQDNQPDLQVDPYGFFDDRWDDFFQDSQEGFQEPLHGVHDDDLDDQSQEQEERHHASSRDNQRDPASLMSAGPLSSPRAATSRLWSMWHQGRYGGYKVRFRMPAEGP